MRKSKERRELERNIREAHEESFNKAMQMVEEEFGGNVEDAIEDKDFVQRMQASVKQLWAKYLAGYEKLEELEQREGFPALARHCRIFDRIALSLPSESRQFCYYPFSGTDFYWARIFQHLFCEDIGFDNESIPNMWWGEEDYSKENRDRVLGLLKKLSVVPEEHEVVCVRSDAERSGWGNAYNLPSYTMLVKGGHDVVGFIEKRFQDIELNYGAILTASSANPHKKLRAYLSSRGFEQVLWHPGTSWIAPYAMELRRVAVFSKCS